MHPDILMLNHPKLRVTAEKVEDFDTDMLFNISTSMEEALKKYNAAGLAAPQIGLPIRLIVAKPLARLFVMVNPVITHREGLLISKEGCLSVPGFWDTLPRDRSIEVEYQDITGRKDKEYLTGLESAVMQHEIDHLNGILFIDMLSSIKQDRAKKKVEIWKRRNQLKNQLRRNK